jgi:hypothetical protein
MGDKQVSIHTIKHTYVVQQLLKYDLRIRPVLYSSKILLRPSHNFKDATATISPSKWKFGCLSKALYTNVHIKGLFHKGL